jgi:anthranilate 1,2-dioxygenase small subunit
MPDAAAAPAEGNAQRGNLHADRRANLRAEVRDLYDDYAAALDDLDFARWTSFFTADCVYKVVSLENHKEGLPLATLACEGVGSLRDRAAAIRQTAVFEPRTVRRFVSGVRIDAVAGSEIESQANFAVFESLTDREPHLFMVGRYLDRLVRGDDGHLLLRERLCVYDNYRVRTSLVYPI